MIYRTMPSTSQWKPPGMASNLGFCTSLLHQGISRELAIRHVMFLLVEKNKVHEKKR